MRIVFRKHALDRMIERGISKEEVEYVLSYGENNRIIRNGGPHNWISNDKFCFHRYLRGRKDNQIAVIAIFPKNPVDDWEIVTVMNNFRIEFGKQARPQGGMLLLRTPNCRSGLLS